MTQTKSSLRLKRMVIFSNDYEVYNEEFHAGTNIIRGENGSGKSTIMNLIFYSLGGDLKDWTPQMLRCDSIIAEFLINNTPITLSREIGESSRKPMSIYYGSYEEAINSKVEGWNIFSYNISNTKKSFSQELFELLDFPEMRSEFESNITMHQLLRLIYLDQKSPADSLFIREDFDSPLVRK